MERACRSRFFLPNFGPMRTWFLLLAGHRWCPRKQKDEAVIFKHLTLGFQGSRTKRNPSLVFLKQLDCCIYDDSASWTETR